MKILTWCSVLFDLGGQLKQRAPQHWTHCSLCPLPFDLRLHRSSQAAELVKQYFLEEPVIWNSFKLVVSGAALTIVLVIIRRSAQSVVLHVLRLNLHSKRSQIFCHSQCFLSERAAPKLSCSDIFTTSFLHQYVFAFFFFFLLFITRQTASTLFSRSGISHCFYISCHSLVKRQHFSFSIPLQMTR